MLYKNSQYLVTWLAKVIFATSLYYGAVQAAQVATAPDNIVPQFKPAEDAAPSGAKADLRALRERGKQAGWKFSVGCTSAFAMPLNSIAATYIPDNFLAMAMAKNELAAKANGAADESARLAGIIPQEFLSLRNPNA